MDHSSIALEPGGHRKLAFILGVAWEARRDANGPPRALDIGCGEGTFSHALARAGWHVQGVDDSFDRVTRARGRCRGTTAHFLVADARRLPLAGRFDLVLCVEIIEHLPDPVPFLAQVHHLLRPGGNLVVTGPNGRSALETQRRALVALKRTPMGQRMLQVKRRATGALPGLPPISHDGDIHLQFLSHTGWTSLLRANGFSVVTSEKASALYAMLRPFCAVSPARSWFGRFDSIDQAVTRRLPTWLAGGWYFACVKS